MPDNAQHPMPIFVGDARRGPSRVRLAIALALCLALLGVLLWLFSPGGEGPGLPANLSDLPRMDGTIVAVEDDQLVMEPFDGRAELTFLVRDADRGQFDFTHLRSHSAIGLPTRLFYRREGGRLYAVYKMDAPANSRGAG